jgi:uncharacterized membrane protein
MSETPVQVIVAAFNSVDEAGAVMADLKQGRKEGLIGIIDAAVVVKDADGKVKVTDAKHRRRKGLITGGLVGALVGLIASPPVGAMAIGGGVIGTLVGRAKAAPLREEMKDIATAMPPNSSAIVAVIEHTWISQLEAVLAAEGAQLIKDAIKTDIAEQLNAGGNVLYTAGGGEQIGGVGRVAETAEGIEVGGVLATPDSILVDSVVITDEPLETEDEEVV